jgi:hypothetical protein
VAVRRRREGLLGYDPSLQSQGRWAVICDLQEHLPIGIWVRVHEVQEWTPTGKLHEWKMIRTWKVSPPDCLLRWEFIVTIQRNVNLEDLKPPGFTSSDE